MMMKWMMMNADDDAHIMGTYYAICMVTLLHQYR